MDLFFHLTVHLLLSFLAGFIAWKLWKKPIASFVSALAGGLLIDLDHIVDYFLAFGISFNLEYFAKGYQFLKSDKIYVPFHGWEYVIVALLLVFILKNKTARSVLLALALGAFFHLSTDVSLNEGAQLKTYSIYYRIKNNFDLKNLVTNSHYLNHQDRKKIINFD